MLFKYRIRVDKVRSYDFLGRQCFYALKDISNDTVRAISLEKFKGKVNRRDGRTFYHLIRDNIFKDMML